jgi:hypothetical protein
MSARERRGVCPQWVPAGGTMMRMRANLIAGRDVEPAFSWGFFDRLLLIVSERVGELVVVFGDQIDIALVLDRGDRRLQRVIELGKCFLLVASGWRMKVL